jgi:hypothetical protein
MESPATVCYHVNDRDEIVSVNPEWDRFALANGGESVTADRVLGRRLWEFIADYTTRDLYRQILIRVRSGRTIRFTFRCDAPALSRVLEMDVSEAGDGTVRFLTRTLSEESRPAVPLPDPAETETRSEARLLVCGWCRKVAVGESWEEVEKAVAGLRLFEQVPMPRTTHGICEACYERVRETMD